jgi:thymidylate kinase
MLTDLCTSFFVAVSNKHLETDTPVIALEGQSYAGKSTSLAALQRAGYGAVREYSELRKYSDSALPRHLVPHSPEQVKEDFLFYLKIERQRYQTYLGLKHIHTAIFLDRSIFTLLAYRLAIQVSTDMLAWAMDTVISDTFPILYPHHVLYIDLPLNLVKQRHQCAGDHLPAYFMDETFYRRFRSFFLVLQTSMPTRITIIDGSQDPSSTLRQIYSVMQARGFLPSI